MLELEGGWIIPDAGGRDTRTSRHPHHNGSMSSVSVDAPPLVPSRPARAFVFPSHGLPDCGQTPPRFHRRLLLDSRVVDVSRSSNLIVVTLSSWNPFFFNGFIKALPFSGNAGAEDPGIQ